MNNAKILRRNPDMVAREMDDETILLPIYRTSEDISCIYTLNKSAAFVWNLIDGKHTVKQIKHKIGEEFGSAPEEVDKEMATLLTDLRQIKAIS